MGIAQEVESSIDLLLETLISSKSAALCGALLPVAASGATIHLLLMGFAIMRGDANDPLHTFVWKSSRMVLIAGIALSAGTYQGLIVDGSDSLVIALLHTMSGFDSVGQLIDEVAEPFARLGQQLWSEAVVGFMPNFGLVVAAGTVAVAEAFIVVVGLGMYLLAKVAFALVMALGPAYLLCAMWPATEKYTESWIGQVLNFAVLKVLIGVCIVMLTDFSSNFADHISVTTDTVNVIKATMSLLMCCAALMVVMLNLPQLASALSGGASLSGIGRTIGRSFLDFLHKGGKDSSKPRPGGGSITPSGRPGSEQGTGPTPPKRQPLFQRNTIEHIRNPKK